MTTNFNEIYKVRKIVFSEKYNDNEENCKTKYFYIGVLQNNMKFKGYSYNIILEGDLLLGPFEKKTDKHMKDNEYYYDFKKNSKIILSNDKNTQIQRINDLVGTENINIFEKFNYGSDMFWINILNEYYKINSNLVEDKINEAICVVGLHIENYHDLILLQFNNKLIEKNIIGIRDKQQIELIIHPDFGINIDSWNENKIHLLFDIEGFGVKTIKKIAEGLNISIDTKMKLNLLFKCNNELCIYFDEYHFNNLLSGDFLYNVKVSFDKFNELVNELLKDNILIIIGDYIYNKKPYEKEHNISKNLINFKNKYNLIKYYNINEDELISEINKFTISNYELNKEQKDAIKMIFNNCITIIHGKAGTGKTSVIKCLLYCINYFKLPSIQLEMLAPTAAAKVRMEVSLNEYNYMKNISYSTIHSFNYPRKGDINIINDYTLFIIDESSMIDINTLNNLISKIKYKYNLFSIIFLGDYRQLPSVGLGDILKNLLKSKNIQNTELITVCRNNDNIKKLLDIICNGEELTKTNKMIFGNNKIISWKRPTTDENFDNYIENIIIDRKDYIIKNETLIITPTNNIVKKYTATIRDIINPLQDSEEINEILYYGKIYRLNDRVIHTKNYKRENLYNGLMGKIYKINQFKDEETKKNHYELLVKFDNNTEFIYKTNEKFFYDLEIAYLITVHKSQGQEFDEVIIIINNNIYDKMLTRNLLYTALSRAKKKLIIISQKENINKAIKNPIERLTLMDQMLNYYSEGNKLDFIDYVNIDKLNN